MNKIPSEFKPNLPEFHQTTLLPADIPRNPLTVSSMVLAHVRQHQLEGTPLRHSEPAIRYALAELLQEHFLGQQMTPCLINEINQYVAFYFPVSGAPRVFAYKDEINITAPGIMSVREYNVKLAERQALCDRLSFINDEIAVHEAADQQRRWNLSASN
jgi:hypothetical protein